MASKDIRLSSAEGPALVAPFDALASVATTGS